MVSVIQGENLVRLKRLTFFGNVNKKVPSGRVGVGGPIHPECVAAGEGVTNLGLLFWVSGEELHGDVLNGIVDIVSGDLDADASARDGLTFLPDAGEGGPVGL